MPRRWIAACVRLTWLTSPELPTPDQPCLILSLQPLACDLIRWMIPTDASLIQMPPALIRNRVHNSKSEGSMIIRHKLHWALLTPMSDSILH